MNFFRTRRPAPDADGDPSAPQKFDKGIFFRFLFSVLLAGAALVLFLISRGAFAPTPAELERHASITAAKVGAEVDSVLAQCGIGRERVTRKEIPVPNSQLIRTERHVALPPGLAAVQVNVALNAMARRYNGRAVASENPKEGTVTIHLEFGGFVVETIILKPSKEPPRRAGSGGTGISAGPHRPASSITRRPTAR